LYQGRSNGLATSWIHVRESEEKLFCTTNLATTVDVYSKSTLMTLLFDAIVDKQTT